MKSDLFIIELMATELKSSREGENLWKSSTFQK